MSESREDHSEESVDPFDDLDAEEVQDDEVIGRAFKASLVAIAAVAMVAAAVFLALRLRGDERAGPAIESTAPLDNQRESVAPGAPFVASDGIDFVHQNGATGERFLPETMGSGVAFFDYDRDQDQDLLLVDSKPWQVDSGRGAVLFENDGAGNFRRVQGSGLQAAIYGTGVAIGDIDNDGDQDVFLAAVGRNRLFENRLFPDGKAVFVEMTAEAGVAGEEEDWSTSAAFFDADGDADLDLFVGNYVKWSFAIDREVNYTLDGTTRAYGPPVNYQGTFSRLYRNEGDGRFADISEQAGIRVVDPNSNVPLGKALGVMPVDLERDGDVDLVVANDTVRNFLFLNQGDAVFEEQGELFGLAYGREGNATGGMGIDASIYRDDGQLAIAIGNFANEMTSLYLSQGDATLFADEAIPEGVGAPSRRALTFGVFFFDYDLDGGLDLLQVNGHLEEEISKVESSQEYRQPIQLFWNRLSAGGASFEQVEGSRTGALAEPIVGRAAAYADIDGDGDLDVAVTQTGDRALLYRNDGNYGAHWLRVRLVGDGKRNSRDAVGVWVELEAGGRTQWRQVMPSRSYQSRVEDVLTFGLGKTTSVDALRVHWRDQVQEVEVEGVDRVLTVEQPD